MSVQKLDARQQLELLFDAGTFTEIDRLMQDGEKAVSVISGYGFINNMPVYAFAQDKSVINGAVSKAHAAKIQSIYRLAEQNGAPLVGVFDSDGIRLTEGLEAMDAVADILSAANNISGVVPQLAVITGSCVGSAALIASAADVVIAVENADYYLNQGDDTANVDIVTQTVEDALQKAREVLNYLPANNLSAAPIVETAEVINVTADSAAELLTDAGSVVSLYRDNVAAFARIQGVPCGIVTLQAEDKLSCCAVSRAARFVRLCDSFSLPIITLVDAAGFSGLQCATKLCQAYAEATAAKITLITGKAYGPVYIAVAGKTAGADVVLAWEEASVSALAPETAVHILWTERLAEMKDPKTDRAALVEEYRVTCCSAESAAKQGAVTDVIAREESRQAVASFMEMLSGKRVTKLPKKHANIRL